MPQIYPGILALLGVHIEQCSIFYC